MERSASLRFSGTPARPHPDSSASCDHASTVPQSRAVGFQVSRRALLLAQNSRIRSDSARRFAGVSRFVPSCRLDAGALSFGDPLTLIGFDDAFAFPAVADFAATVFAAARLRGVAEAISIPNISDRSSLTSTFVLSGPVGFFLERLDPAFAIRPCWSTFRSVHWRSGHDRTPSILHRSSPRDARRSR